MKRFILIILILGTFIPTLVLAQTRGLTAPAKKLQAPSGAVMGVNRALLIGNNNYRSKKWPKLKTAEKDVTELAKVLIARYGYKKENVRLLKSATRREMMRGFLELAEKTGKNDSVVIYYAGHGEYDKNDRGWWIPVDGEDSSNYISNDEVLANLRAIKAKHRLLISDSCFSGNLLTRGIRTQPKLNMPLAGYFREKNSLISVQGLSSGGNEPVSDGGAEWGGQSIFAYHLLGILKANQKRYLSGTLLGYKIAEVVANDTATFMGQGQTPVFSPIKNQGDQGGEFFFVPTDMGSLKAIPIMLFFEKTPNAEFQTHSATARQEIKMGLEKLMNRFNMQVKGVQEVDQGNLGMAISAQMKKNKADSALVISLDGKMEEQSTLMWQGISTLRMTLHSYRFDNNKLKKIGSVEFKTQRLPMRRWTTQSAQIEKNYGKTASKMTKKWSRAKMSEIFSNFEN